jgi:hypothetical protein
LKSGAEDEEIVSLNAAQSSALVVSIFARATRRKSKGAKSGRPSTT